MHYEPFSNRNQTCVNELKCFCPHTISDLNLLQQPNISAQQGVIGSRLALTDKMEQFCYNSKIRAAADIFLNNPSIVFFKIVFQFSCFAQMTVENPEIFSLLAFKNKKHLWEADTNRCMALQKITHNDQTDQTNCINSK